MNPYEVLDIYPPVNDAAVRARYLELVRQFPPEQHPERFTEINRAYEMVKDQDRRLQHALFPLPLEERSPMEAVIAHFRRKRQRVPISSDEMKTFLQNCALD